VSQTVYRNFVESVNRKQTMVSVFLPLEMLSALYWREKQKVIGRELGSKLDWESVIVPVFSKFLALFAYREEKPLCPLLLS